MLTAIYWWAILLSLAVATAGWSAKLSAWHQADALIVSGTTLVVIVATLALRRIARQVGLPIVCPLCLLGAGMVLLVLEPLCHDLALPATLLLRPLGEIAAALGVVRLLLNLNGMLVSKPVAPKYQPATSSK